MQHQRSVAVFHGTLCQNSEVSTHILIPNKKDRVKWAPHRWICIVPNHLFRPTVTQSSWIPSPVVLRQPLVLPYFQESTWCIPLSSGNCEFAHRTIMARAPVALPLGLVPKPGDIFVKFHSPWTTSAFQVPHFYMQVYLRGRWRSLKASACAMKSSRLRSCFLRGPSYQRQLLVLKKGKQYGKAVFCGPCLTRRLWWRVGTAWVRKTNLCPYVSVSSSPADLASACFLLS